MMGSHCQGTQGTQLSGSGLLPACLPTPTPPSSVPCERLPSAAEVLRASRPLTVGFA